MLKLYSFIVVSIFTLLSTADHGCQPPDRFFLQAKGRFFSVDGVDAVLGGQPTLLRLDGSKLKEGNFHHNVARLNHGKVLFTNFGDELSVSYNCDHTVSPRHGSMFHSSNHMLFYHFLIFSVSIIGFCVVRGSPQIYVTGQRGTRKHILLLQIPSFLYTSTNSIR
jgi:hypothetical protein